MPRPVEQRFARLAVERGWIREAQAEAALLAVDQSVPPVPVEVILVELGMLDLAQVVQLLSVHAEELAALDRRMGEVLGAWRFAALTVNRGLGSAADALRGLRAVARREGGDEPHTHVGEARPDSPAAAPPASAGRPAARPSEAAVTLTDEKSAARTVPTPPEPSARHTQGTPSAAESRTASRAVGRRFGPYEILAEIGHGGMGVVYKAWHAGLRRHYAVKGLPATDEESRLAVERLRREAQALARLAHPGIVAVQDIWEDEGRTFLAMEFIEGETLDRVLQSVNGGVTQFAPGAGGGADPPFAPPYDPLRRTVGLPTPEAIRIARETAEAIQHAHEMGVLHRDLKPANLIREEQGRIRVMDFGLAKLTGGGGTKVTRTGSLMGTPAYISPEQVDEGMEAVDAKSDVYQIGAILYELLTGRPPYEGDGAMEILLRISQHDPHPPRKHNPRVARDAETICLTAMARDRARRYPTAGHLADDCRRFLAGEAIQARREGPAARAYRWMRRHRALVSAAAVLALTATIAVGAAWTARRARIDQAELERQVLDGLREIARTNLQAALLVRRAGGRMDETEAAFLEPLRAASRRAVERAPSLAEPHVHLGRMYRVLLRFDEAILEQDQALAKEPDHAAARYERAILRAIAYGRRLSELRRRWLEGEGRRLAQTGALTPGGGAPGVGRDLPRDAELADADPLALRLRTGIAEDLLRLEASAVRAELPPAVLASARGHALLYAGRREARVPLEEALRLDPTLEEVVEALAHLALAVGDRARADALYSRGLERDRGYLPFWIGRGELRAKQGTADRSAGRDPEASYRAAESDFQRAVELAPRQARPRVLRADVRVEWGEWLEGRGLDPEPLWLAAEADAGGVIQIEPDLPDGYRLRAGARARFCFRFEELGKDGASWFESALADSDRAVALAPLEAISWLQRAQIRLNWGLMLRDRGRDPEAVWQASLADFARALELDLSSEGAWRNRGVLRLNWAATEAARGRDPEPWYAQAEADLLKAVDLDPRNPSAWLALCGLCSNRALTRQTRGMDPEPSFAEADRYAARMLEANPELARGWLFRGSLRMNWGVYRHDRGEDPDQQYRQAESDLSRGIQLNPGSAEGWSSRGLLYVNWGLDAGQRGGEAEDFYRKGIEDFDRALELNPASAETWRERGLLYGNRGLLHSRIGSDPIPDFEACVRDIRKSLELNPQSAAAWARLGDAWQNWGSYEESRGVDPSERYREAAAVYDRALELSPAWAEGYWRRGIVRLNWGNSRMKVGSDPAPDYEAASRDFDRAAELNPNDPDLWLAVGQLHLVWGMSLEVRGGRGRSGIESPNGRLRGRSRSIRAPPMPACGADDSTWPGRATAAGGRRTRRIFRSGRSRTSMPPCGFTRGTAKRSPFAVSCTANRGVGRRPSRISTRPWPRTRPRRGRFARPSRRSRPSGRWKSRRRPGGRLGGRPRSACTRATTPGRGRSTNGRSWVCGRPRRACPRPTGRCWSGIRDGRRWASTTISRAAWPAPGIGTGRSPASKSASDAATPTPSICPATRIWRRCMTTPAGTN